MITKDVGFRIRVNKELRQEFVYVYRAQGKTAAQVLREFMVEYADKNREKSQIDLFEKTENQI